MNIASTLHRFAGRCPPRGLIFLGAALRKIVAPTLHRFASVRLGFMAFGLTLLAACGNTPPAPDWQGNALGAVKSFTSAYLAGDSKVADFEFARGRTEISATGRPDLVARVELVRCAVRLASLELDTCAAAQLKTPDLAAPERAYALFLDVGQAGSAPTGARVLDASQIALLPEQHRPMFSARDDSARVATLSTMTDPLARLVAAGVLFGQGQLPPAGVEVAVNTASEQGWRRPLLAWLGVQLKLAQNGGDAAASARIQRRIHVASGADSSRAKP